MVAQLSASANVCKDFKCFNEHANPGQTHLKINFIFQITNSIARNEKKSFETEADTLFYALFELFSCSYSQYFPGAVGWTLIYR